MALVDDNDWQEYRDMINEFHEDAFQQDIIWKKEVTSRDYNGEDSNIRYESKTLKGLAHYNYFRAWPLNQATEAGEIDKESVLVYFNLKYLEGEGLLNQHGQFEFDPVSDRFEINGVGYKNKGESQAGQVSTDPILTFIILKREETNTGSHKY